MSKSVLSRLTLAGDGRAVQLQERLDNYEAQTPGPIKNPISPGPAHANSQAEPPAALGEVESQGLFKAWPSPAPGLGVGAGLLAVLLGAAYLLWPLLKGGTIAGFTRLERQHITEHPVRASLVELIESNPGLHFREIQRRLGVANGTLRHHLRALEGHGLIAKASSHGYTCYFPKGRIDFPVMAVQPLLRSPRARVVLDAVRDQPGCTAARLARVTGQSPTLLRYYVARLRDAGLVTTTPAGRESHIHPTPMASRALADAAPPSTAPMAPPPMAPEIVSVAT